jgi:hypothetical protein
MLRADYGPGGRAVPGCAPARATLAAAARPRATLLLHRRCCCLLHLRSTPAAVMRALVERLPLRVLNCLAQGCRCWLQPQQHMRKPRRATPHLSSPAQRQHLSIMLATFQIKAWFACSKAGGGHLSPGGWHDYESSRAERLTCMLMAVLAGSTAIAMSPAGCRSATLKYTSRPPRPPGCS